MTSPAVTREQATRRRRRIFSTAAAAAFVAALALPASGRDLARRFVASLRIAKPKPVSVNAPPSFSGPNANRRVLEAVSGMIASKVNVTLDEPDQSAANAEAAARLAGFAAQLPRARTDRVTLIVTGAHAVQMATDRGNLRTTLTQAGRPGAALPRSLDGATAAVKTPRAIRAQYGNCPAPVASTIQSQLTEPAPLTPENGTCIVLTEGPAASAEIPDSLDVAPLVEIALELAGMSPNQAQVFQNTFDWKSTLVLSMPRGMRSYEAVTVNGARGMLVTTAARRGPTYTLIWTGKGMVFALAGYGNPGDAVALANSVR